MNEDQQTYQGSKTKVLKIKSRVTSFRRQWSFAGKELILSDVGDDICNNGESYQSTHIRWKWIKNSVYRSIGLWLGVYNQPAGYFCWDWKLCFFEKMSIGCGCSSYIRPEHHIEKTMYTSNRHPSCDHIFVPTVIVNNTSSNVVGSRGSLGQRVSSRRHCIHPSGSTASCRIDQQPSFVGTERHCPVRKRSAKLVLVRLQAQNVRLTKQYSSSERESAFEKPPHVIASSESRNYSKNMSRFSSNDIVHNHYLEEAKKKKQERDMNSRTKVMSSAIVQNIGTSINVQEEQTLNLNVGTPFNLKSKESKH
nr:hypothetical protein [Tanacetum cinerariifolium]